MGDTFTISQQPDSTNLWIYPVSSGSVDSQDLTPFGETNNWECVDEVYSAPDITTYVYTTSAVSLYDMYNLTDHTTETGNINYVQLVNRAVSSGYEQHANGNYRVGLNVSGVTYWSVNKDITQTYDDYSITYASQPSDASDWNWVAVDALQSGVSCNSPLISGASVSRTYVPHMDEPHATDSLYRWIYTSTFDGQDGTHWDRVMDDVADTGAGVGSGGGGTAATWHYDMYNTIPEASAASITSDIIQKVVVNSKVYRWNFSEYDSHFKPSIQIGSTTTYYGTERDRDTGLDTGFNIFNDEWTSQPSDLSPWTAVAINQLKVGAAMKYEGSPDTGVACWDLSYTVYYTEDFTPEIRTTQSYVKINYIPTPATVTLNQPSSLQVSHSRNVGRTTFASGEYEVTDYGRSGKTLTLSGQETSTASATMQGLKDICHFGAKITVSGLDDTNLNTDYHIVNFSFSQEAGMVGRYMWTISLEED